MIEEKKNYLKGKNKKAKYHLRFMLKDIFGFCEDQQKACFGLGYKLKLTRNKDVGVIANVAGIANARIRIDQTHWYVPLYTPSIQKQGILSKQNLSGTPTELRYFERSVFVKEVNKQNLLNFELGSQENMNVPI